LRAITLEYEGFAAWPFTSSCCLVNVTQLIGTRLPADGSGGFRCYTSRDLEAATLTVAFVADIDSGLGKK